MARTKPSSDTADLILGRMDKANDETQVAIVSERTTELRELNSEQEESRTIIRDVLDGGTNGLKAIIGKDFQSKDHRIPAANLMLSGLTRLAQKTGGIPEVKVDPPSGNDSDRARERAERRARIVSGYDHVGKLQLDGPQMARWCPGYGFTPWVIEQSKTPKGDTLPKARIRDPYMAFPDQWGTEQQPNDIAFLHTLPLKDLVSRFPEHEKALRAVANSHTSISGATTPAANHQGWESQSGGGIDVYEYHNIDGTWWVVPEKRLLLSFSPNPLSRAAFYVAKRFSFNKLIGQYDHVIGLMSAMARLNVLSIIAAEDATFAEALSLDTPLPTPTGWTTMGEVQPGDQLVGSDGLPTHVTKATEVQHDRTCYRVTFEDGTSVIASDGHLWETRIAGTRMEPRVRTTQEMVDDGRTFRVPAAGPWKLPEADLDIDPYMLGLWLGDGHSNNAIITTSDEDLAGIESLIRDAGFTTKLVAPQPDRAPMVYVSEPGAGTRSPGSGLHAKLRTNGLFGNKHIPTHYLRSSIEQRTELLQGLMDSDGTVNPGGNCCFSNTNTALADGLVELLRSLGEVPVKHWAVDSRARGGGWWLVTFTPRNVMPFRLERKANRVSWHSRGGQWVSIKSIEPVDSVPVRCIAVDSTDRLFLAGPGAHATHNTNVSGELAQGHNYRRGRNAVNYLRPGSQVERMQTQVPFELFQQIDRLERQLRVTSGYNVTDDAQSPNSFVTGRGLEELEQGIDNEIQEYFTVYQDTFQELDSLRLEWDERVSGGRQKTLNGVLKGSGFEERYTPDSAIDGDWLTRRDYGAMASLDEPRKVVALLNFMQNDVIDADTVREHVPGLGDINKIAERVRQKRLEEVMMQFLSARAEQGDLAAMEAVVGMLREGDVKEVLETVFIPEEEEQQAQAQQPAQPQGGAPPDVQTALARMTQGGPNLGVQTTTRNQ